MNISKVSSQQSRILGENGLLGIPQQDLLKFLLSFDPKKPLPKKVHELLVGYLLVQFLEDDQKESAIIGFPAAEDWGKQCIEVPLTLDWLLEHDELLIDDTDADIMVRSSGITIKYQVTRFVYPVGGNALRRLADLIAYKCKHQQPDPHLNLLVSIERTPHITESELQSLLIHTSIPFNSILLIMKSSRAKGEIKFCSLYPKMVIGKTVHTRLPI